MLVTFEGLDLCGKSTLIKEVNESHFNSLMTKEPGSPLIDLNKELRKLALENKSLSAFGRELIFYVDALNHKKAMELFDRTVALSDRGIWSHYAYAYGCMKLGLLGNDPDQNYTRYGLCKKLIAQCCAQPDGVIYLQGDLKLMEERARGTKDIIESLGKEFFAYVLVGYDDLVIARELEQKPTLILDARSSIEDNKEKSLQFIHDLQNLSIGDKIVL